MFTENKYFFAKIPSILFIFFIMPPFSIAQSAFYGYYDTMNAIITVVGSDQVGIIARVSAHLAQHKINIIDITQTVLSGNFVMMMMVDLSGSPDSIEDLRAHMEALGTEMAVEINIMHERVFTSMHRI